MFLSDISTYSFLVWISAAITASFGLIVYIGGPNRSSRAFLSVVLSLAVWMTLVGAFISSATIETATIFVKFAYLSGLINSASFFYFFLIYPSDDKPPRYILPILSAIILVNAYIFIFTDLVINQAYSIEHFVRYGWTTGPLWWLFYAIFYTFFIGGISFVIRVIPRLKEIRQRHNIKYMLISVLVVLTPPTLMNIILPQFGHFEWIWLGPTLGIGWIAILAYSIIRFRQMDIRTFTTEILNVALIIIFFTNIFTDISIGVWGRVLTFLIFLVISYYIIRLGSRVDDLNRNLQSKVEEQTKEIHDLYETEKKSRQELERLNEAKDQFILITQHHLRTPLTQVKWTLETLRSRTSIDETYVRDIDDALGSVGQLNHLMEDFLNISELKAGQKILTIESASFLPIIENILKEWKSEVQMMALNIDLPRSTHLWPDIPIDISRIRELLYIVVQNAVKYNEQGGRIVFEPSQEAESFVLKITNTGIGIDPADLASLFTGVFNRGATAMSANPLGMGMGLTFAQYIAKAHKGSISVTSDGIGKGASVTIRMPLRGE